MEQIIQTPGSNKNLDATDSSVEIKLEHPIIQNSN